MLTLLLALQIFHVVFLLLHDWVPLGPLNDTHAVRAEHPAWKMLVGTFVSTLPFIILLAFSLHFQHRGYPRALIVSLWAGYIFLFLGELEAWWLPWFGRSVKQERVASYERMFGATHAFLPARNGIRINTLHVILHSATVATLAVLAVLSFQRFSGLS